MNGTWRRPSRLSLPSPGPQPEDGNNLSRTRRHRPPPGLGAPARAGLRPLVELVAPGPPPLRLDRPRALAPVPQPGPAPDQRGAETVGPTPGGPGVPAHLRGGDAVPRRLSVPLPLVRQDRPGPLRARGLFLDGVRPPRVPGRLLGRPGGPVRRPLQGGQRPGGAPGGGRSPLPLRLLPADRRRRRLSAAHLSRLPLRPPPRPPPPPSRAAP